MAGEPAKKSIFSAHVWPNIWRAKGAAIDLVDACNLRCPECVRGSRRMKNSQDRMDFKQFTEICGKLQSECISELALYNWSEPFLHPEIDKFVAFAVEKNFMCQIASNLSLPEIPSLISTLDAGLAEISVSVSGFTQKIHEVYHRGSNIKILRKHLHTIVKAGYAKKVVINFLNFGYNTGEVTPFEEYAHGLGVRFSETKASGNPLRLENDEKVSTTLPSRYPILKHENKEFIHYNAEKMPFEKGKICEIAINPTIDCRGAVYSCCDRPSSPLFLLGNYLELTFEEMLLKNICIQNVQTAPAINQ